MKAFAAIGLWRPSDGPSQVAPSSPYSPSYAPSPPSLSPVEQKDNVNQFQTLVVKATTAASQNDDWGTILEVAEIIADIIQAHK